MRAVAHERAGRCGPPAGPGAPRRPAVVGAAAVLTSVAAVAALHVLRPELDPAGHRLSEYAVGPWGWVMTGAFVAFAVGLWSLRHGVPTHGPLRPARALLAVAAAGMTVSAVFETDAMRPDALREVVHSTASSGAFLALVAAALWTATVARSACAWSTPPALPDALTALALLGAIAGPIAHDGPWTGAVQRASYLVLIVWLVVLSRGVAAPRSDRRRKRRRPPSR